MIDGIDDLGSNKDIVSFNPETEERCREILKMDKLTGEDVCFLISECYSFSGEKKSPKEIWNASPDGELFHVYMLFNFVKESLKDK